MKGEGRCRAFQRRRAAVVGAKLLPPRRRELPSARLRRDAEADSAYSLNVEAALAGAAAELQLRRGDAGS